MNQLQETAILVLHSLSCFTAGYIVKDLIDRESLAKATKYVEAANIDLDAIQRSHNNGSGTCTSSQALAWWTESGNLEKAKAQLCGKARSNREKLSK